MKPLCRFLSAHKHVKSVWNRTGLTKISYKIYCHQRSYYINAMLGGLYLRFRFYRTFKRNTTNTILYDFCYINNMCIIKEVKTKKRMDCFVNNLIFGLTGYSSFVYFIASKNLRHLATETIQEL